MGQHAKLISDLKLVKELRRSAGREDIQTEDVEKLVALVNEVADVAGPLLERIPATFKQYTEHNLLHCRNLIDLMGRFIPRETLKQLNALELAVLILSALLHDFGMFVSEKEKRGALKSSEFDAFLAGHHDRATALEEARRNHDHERAEIIQDALLAEYFRRLHPERARVNVRANLHGKLFFRDVDITDYVLDVCESHAWGVHESNDPRHPHNSVSRLSTNKAVYGVSLNLQYAACCLRLADIMDFDRSRTPLVVFQNIDFTEEKSWEEWNKHLSIKGWVVKENDVLFRAECKKPAYYVAVMEFLDWVDYELGECRRLVTKEAPHDIAALYKLHLPPVVDRTEVEMEDKNYLAGAFRFQLEYDRIMQLLMDKSLYPDPSLFLRELLQNSLDACRNREAHAKEAGPPNSYTPRICVWDYSDDPQDPRIIFQDNGIGMSRRIVENYFMRVGRSYYRSPEFDAERARLKKKHIDLEATSQFGIGILSCFMVADRFEVETYKTGNDPLHITIEGPTKYFTIKLLPEPPRTDFPPPPATDLQDGPPNRPGTRITIHLRPDEPRPKVYETLNTFAVNVEYDIHVHQSTDPHQQTIPRRRWEPKKPWLNTLGRGKKDIYYDVPLTAAKEFEEVLVPSPISLTANDISPRLRGSAWLWMLQDEGGLCPQRGYLKIRGQYLMVTGLPLYVTDAKESIPSDRKPEEIIKTIQANLPSKYDEEIGADEQAVVERALGEQFSYYANKFARLWNRLSPDERRVFHEAIGMNFGQVHLRWHRSSSVVKELLRGDYECAKRPLKFRDLTNLGTYPREVALHGVLLPAGLLRWDPMAGTSSKLELMTTLGGVQLDVRGPAVPTPAASRLFVDSREAGKVLVPFTRVVLRHALEVAASNPSAPGWDDWLADLLGNLPGTLDAAPEEWESLRGRLKYLVRVGDDEIHLSRQEVIQKLGRWVFISDGDPYEPHGDRLMKNASTVLLIASHVKRQRAGGLREVDMESDIPVSWEAFKKRGPWSWRMHLHQF